MSLRTITTWFNQIAVPPGPRESRARWLRGMKMVSSDWLGNVRDGMELIELIEPPLK